MESCKNNLLYKDVEDGWVFINKIVKNSIGETGVLKNHKVSLGEIGVLKNHCVSIGETGVLKSKATHVSGLVDKFEKMLLDNLPRRENDVVLKYLKYKGLSTF